MREKLRTVLQIIIGNCNCFTIIAHFDLSGGIDDICGYGSVQPGKEQCISISEIMISSFHMIYQILESDYAYFGIYIYLLEILMNFYGIFTNIYGHITSP